MPHRTLEDAINRLYQGPLESFTAERNALAKTAGAEAARVRALVKPSVAAWAVNQLYWRQRGEWDALIAAAEGARRAHKAVLGGRAGDVRAAGKVHDEAVESALKATLALVAEGGHPATDATRQAIVNTLRALPADAPPGRLNGPLQPGGFEMLAGLSVGRGARAAHPASPSRPPAPAPAPRQPRGAKPDPRALTQAKEEARAAERELRDAEHALKHQEFEAARTAREERRAAEAADKARLAVERARHDLERAEEALEAARGEREATERRVRESAAALDSAKTRADAAAGALRKLQ